MSADDEVLSLYFQLKEGRQADLEVVAEAALVWVQAVRAAAKSVAPEVEIRIELVDATEGSLRLNNALVWIESISPE